jgi:hypothetical protein
VTSASRLHPFARGRPRLVTVRWPRATGLTSYLSGCLVLTSRRRALAYRRRFGSVLALPVPVCFPARVSRCLAFRRLSSADPVEVRQSHPLRAGAQ